MTDSKRAAFEAELRLSSAASRKRRLLVGPPTDHQAAREAFKANPIAGFRAEVIERALAHGQMHINRAIARGIDAPEVDASESAFMAALHNLGEAEADAARDAASEAAHEALSNWNSLWKTCRADLTALTRINAPNSTKATFCRCFVCVDSLDYLACAECHLAPEKIMTDVAAELFVCPGFPEEGDV